MRAFVPAKYTGRNYASPMSRRVLLPTRSLSIRFSYLLLSLSLCFLITFQVEKLCDPARKCDPSLARGSLYIPLGHRSSIATASSCRQCWNFRDKIVFTQFRCVKETFRVSLRYIECSQNSPLEFQFISARIHRRTSSIYLSHFPLFSFLFLFPSPIRVARLIKCFLFFIHFIFFYFLSRREQRRLLCRASVKENC